MLHTFDYNIQKAEAGGSLGVQGQPGLHNEVQASQGYVERWF